MSRLQEGSMLGVRGLKQSIFAMLPLCGITWSKCRGQLPSRLSSLALRAPHPGSCSILLLYCPISIFLVRPLKTGFGF